MTHALLLQLPIPRQNFGRKTGNIPLGAACLKLATRDLPGLRVEILPVGLASYLGDAALSHLLAEHRPDIAGFTVFSWNLARSLDLSEKLKIACGSRIIFGGPEITADNKSARAPHVDFYVYGAGETLFRRLMRDSKVWLKGRGAESAAEVFRMAESPYLSGVLDADMETLMLLETQRGCPYRCGFCFYNKSQKRLVFAEKENLLRAVAWAIERQLAEIYLLDPSLNARPGLKALLSEIARLNEGGRTRLLSEIRAEAVDDELADLLAAAGFHWLEIGLQSTNPRALQLMNRPTRLNQFVDGARRLQARGITPSIDLIVGLPGDDLRGFMRSVDFVVDHELHGDVQIFPLSVLPGTEFRHRSRELGLNYEPHPPYTVTATPGFSPEDFLLAYDYAESRMDSVFFPLPDLDLSWRLNEANGGPEVASDVYVTLEERAYLAKLALTRERPVKAIKQAARRLTLPYQVLVAPGIPFAYLKSVLAVTTIENPFTPLEIVFFEPTRPPRTGDLLSAVHLKRPHYLDGDLRFLFAQPGNRAVLLTWVSTDPSPRFQGDMERQVFWWRRQGLPKPRDLAEFKGLDGILIDAPVPAADIVKWQDRYARAVSEKYHISFADLRLQRRWLLRASPDEYVEKGLGWQTG